LAFVSRTIEDGRSRESQGRRSFVAILTENTVIDSEEAQGSVACFEAAEQAGETNAPPKVHPRHSPSENSDRSAIARDRRRSHSGEHFDKLRVNLGRKGVRGEKITRNAWPREILLYLVAMMTFFKLSPIGV
jgi:hypothetical protein